MRGLWAVVAVFSVSTAANAALDIEVTHEESNFDVRAVDPEGRAFGLKLNDSTRRVWMSTDNARTWTYRGEHPGGSFKQMTALSDGTLIADTQSDRGIHLSRSVDRGATWSEVIALGDARMLTPKSVAEIGGTTFFLEYQSVTSASVPVRLWASTNKGATWSVRYTFLGHRHGHGLQVAPDGALWALFGDAGLQSGIFRSTDLGHSWQAIAEGEHACAVDGVFINGDFVYGQDIPRQPGFPHVARLAVNGNFTAWQQLPGPSYSMMALPTGGYLMGITRESTGDVYPPGPAGESAHLMASVDGESWIDVGSFPRIDASDYARADVYWRLPSGEVVLNLRHVKTLPGGRGYRLLRVRSDSTPEPVTFSDDFNACTSDTSAGARWDVTGNWYCRAERVRGEAPGVALARTADLQRTEVAALVQLNGSTGSGLIARAQGNSYYAARLLSSGRIEIVRVEGTQTRVLASAARDVRVNTSYRMSLSVVGTTLVASVNGTPALSATDSTPLPAGRAGLLSGSNSRTQYDDFVLDGDAPSSSPDVSFANDFSTCPDDAPLGSAWSTEGTWYCKASRARGESALGLALAQTPEVRDMDVGALVQLNGSAGSGVVARAKSGSYYAARMFEGGRIELVRVTPSGTTLLGVGATPVAFNTSRRLLLRVRGSSTTTLEVFLDGLPFFSATDDTSLPAGRGGLLSGSNARTQFDDFLLKSI